MSWRDLISRDTLRKRNGLCDSLARPLTQRYGSTRAKSAPLVPQRELRVLGHLVRGPRRLEDHRGSHLLDALELADELLDLLADLRADRARRRRQREGDVDVAAVDVDPVDEPQLDEVETELGVDDVRQGVLDRLDRG